MREIHHLVYNTFSGGKVIPIPNLDKGSVDGFSKGYHQA